MMKRVKVLSPFFRPGTILMPCGEWNGLEFTCDINCRDYDWLVVYDEMRKDHLREVLACDPAKTILVTQEPPSIKLYPPVYTRQFNYLLSTHEPELVRHPHHQRAEGCFTWLNQRSYDENAAARDYPKSELISVVISGKAMKHTEHYKRFTLVSHLQKNIPELIWYGHGVRPLKHKYEAMDGYRYHLAIENHIHPFHWSEKLSDSMLSLCLPFYAGDPRVDDIFPEESFIRLPIDDHEEALRIIKEAIANNEYEKRLPAIREARRRIIERYNLFSQIARVIDEHDSRPDDGWRASSKKIIGRRQLRYRPIPLLRTAWNAIRGRWMLKRLHRKRNIL